MTIMANDRSAITGVGSDALIDGLLQMCLVIG